MSSLGIRMRLIIKRETTNWWMKNAREWCLTCATCGVVSRRVPCREFASAVLQRCSKRAQGDASRPPASERLPPGPPRAPRPRHARATHRLHRHTPAAPPHAARCLTTYPRPSPQRAHAPRDYRCVLWDVSRGAGTAGRGTHRAGGAGAVLRAASRICLDAFLRAPAARHLQRRARRERLGVARSAMRRRPLIATVLIPSAKLFALHPLSSIEPNY